VPGGPHSAPATVDTKAGTPAHRRAGGAGVGRPCARSGFDRSEWQHVRGPLFRVMRSSPWPR